MADKNGPVDDALALLVEQFEAGIEKVAEILAVQQAQIDELAARRGPVEPLSEPGRPGAPVGKVRFASGSKQLGLWFLPFRRWEVDGQTYLDRGRKLEFEDGILDLDEDDPAVEFLRNHDEYGSDFWEDQDAERLPGPTVREGPKTTKQTTPSRPVAPDELVARL